MDWKLEYDRVRNFLNGRDLNEIDSSEIQKFTKGEINSLMRLVCLAELYRCREVPGYFDSLEPGDIRNMWYAVVKPFLSRVEPPEQVQSDRWGRYVISLFFAPFS